MFRWYRQSRVCYVYLADVADDDKIKAPESFFRRSRWFTRGWTLQELLAPKRIQFFGSSWEFIAERDDLSSILYEITGIPPKFLDGDLLDRATIAQRMSWAARRTTTRREDMAYCLLG